MNRKIALVATTAALASAALGLGLDGPASAHTTVHTLSFTSHQLADRIVNDTDIAASKDLQHGTVAGYDLTRCKVNVTTHLAHCDVAIARAAGMLFGRAHVNVETGKGAGTVTGGTARFAGATGTITVASPTITIHWSN
jgi:hypothetical protein